MDGLNERKEKILRAVVVEYIVAAEPVASDLLANKYELGVRSATIRNEMAEISELGYLEQPHTSAGRIPSDQGYRYYVDNLTMVQKIDRQSAGEIESSTVEDTTSELLRETSKGLSRATKLLTAALSVRDAGVVVRNVVVTALGPNKALLVFLLRNGHVENRVLDCPAGLTLDDVGKVNEKLESLVAGQSLGRLAQSKQTASVPGPAGKLFDDAWNLVRSICNDLTAGHLILEGEEYIVGQPEFRRDPAALEDLITSLTQEDDLIKSISKDEASEITIGKENSVESHRRLAIIRRQFYVGDEPAGLIAVIGPTRMDYERNRTLLDFTASAVTQTLTRLYG